MPSPIDNVPFLGGYRAAQEDQRQNDMDQLKQAGALLTLRSALDKQAKEQAFRNDISALGPSPNIEAVLSVATKHAAPPDLLETYLKHHDRTQAAADRMLQFAQNLDVRQQQLNLARDQFNQRVEDARQRATDAASRQQFEQWYKTEALRFSQEYKNESLKNQQAANSVNQQLRMMGLEIQRQGQQLQLQRLQDRPMTEFQGKAGLYGTRAAQSDKILRDLEDKISVEGLATKQAMSRVPVVGGVLGYAANLALSPEQQRVEQAQRDFVNAVLRQESGAVISDAEFENARKQYFPAPGDSKDVVGQKRRNRELAIQGFARMAGSRGAEDINAILSAPLMPGQPTSGRSSSGQITPPPPPGFRLDQ